MMAAAQPQSVQTRSASTAQTDVVVVGAGFSGLYLLHKLRGLGLRVKVFEQGGDVGGTWYWNRYPGARCDVESMQYSFSFDDKLQQSWDWSERYAPQPEILRYAGHVADRYDLRRDITFNTRVESAVFDEIDNRWTVTTSDGMSTVAQYVVLATGCLSNARSPDFKGLKDFKGKVYHTGSWPHEAVDFTGLRVGVIGTGSSAIQSIPIIADQAKQLYVFQRTANFSVPARNATLTDAERKTFRDNYAEIRGIYQPVPDRGALDDPEEARREKYEARWTSGGLTFMGVYNNLGLDLAANDTAAGFIRDKIADIVKDPETARLLQPNSHPVGTKRICVDTDYYTTFNRPNVKLVDIKTNPIEEILRQDRDSRPQWPDAERQMGGRSAHLSRPHECGLSEPVHHHRPRLAIGAVQHAGLHRAACGLDHRLPQRHGQTRCRDHRGHARSRGQMGRSRQRGGVSDALSAGE
jgi:cyclohexanone monooxygenase